MVVVVVVAAVAMGEGKVMVEVAVVDFISHTASIELF